MRIMMIPRTMSNELTRPARGLASLCGWKLVRVSSFALTPIDSALPGSPPSSRPRAEWAMSRSGESGSAPVLEVLHGTFVLLSRRARLERAEVAPFACLRILLARVEPIAAAAKLANHCRASLCGLDDLQATVPQPHVLLLQLTVEHPVDAELVREHAEPGVPELIGKRHHDRAALGHCCEQAIDLFDTLAIDIHQHVVALRDRFARHAIGGHDDGVATRKASVHDTVLIAGRHGSIGLREHHHVQVSTKALGIERHRFARAAVEVEVWLKRLHPISSGNGSPSTLLVEVQEVVRRRRCLALLPEKMRDLPAMVSPVIDYMV